MLSLGPHATHAGRGDIRPGARSEPISGWPGGTGEDAVPGEHQVSRQRLFGAAAGYGAYRLYDSAHHHHHNNDDDGGDDYGK